MKSEPDMQTKSSSSDNGVGMYKISFMGPQAIDAFGSFIENWSESKEID